MSGDPARAELDSAVLAWMREEDWARDDARFDALALELFAFQFEHCAPYRHFCERRGRTPARVRDWREVPPVPTGAFKELALTSFPSERSVHAFRTSGTTGSARGVLHLDTLELYEASLLASFRRGLLPDLSPGGRATFCVLAPSPEELPDSSLSHMFGVVVAALGTRESRFVVRRGKLDVEEALHCLRGASPLVLCGTAFAFVHLLDLLESRGLAPRLPHDTRVMETGGFKGRSRALPRDALYAAIEAGLGVPRQRVVNQYGMTELGSQFYDSVLWRPHEPRRKLAPPWARVRLVEAGAIVVFDLANTGSVFALQTADRGRRLDDGFEVLGREPGAEERGCSIAADELLDAAP